MRDLLLILAIAALVTVVIGVVIVAVLGLRRLMLRAGVRRVTARYRPGEPRRVDTAANFFGLGSRGARQLRGSGVLVLTPGELWFGAHVMRKELCIPMSDIREVGLVGAHLRKKILGRPLLHLRFAGEGGEDTVAWLVDDPEGWRADIEHWRGQAPRTPERAGHAPERARRAPGHGGKQDAAGEHHT